MRVIGVDIGGTFTDLMLYDTDSAAVHVHKVRSTPSAPDQAMVQGISELCAQAGVDSGRCRRRLPRHDGRDERGARVLRGRGRA